jgi:cobalt-zinc-cadmium efflux system outer membrane protein
MRARVVCAALAAALLPASPGAQTLLLTESQAVARLSAESPRVQAVRAAVDVARADVLSAGRWPNPRVTFNREAVAGVTENMVMVAQLLPVAGRRRFEVSAASARVEAATSRADDAVRRLRADLRLAFTDLWAAQARERELARSRDQLRELADVIGRRETAGEAAGFDRLRAEREVIDVEADRAAAAIERVQAHGILASFFAAAPVVDVIDASRPEPPTVETRLPPVDELMATAERMRGEFAALQRELDAAAFLEQAAVRLRVPEPEIVGGTKSSNAGTGDLGSIISVHVNVPLFDRGGPERAVAQARAAQLRAEVETLRLSVRTQIAAWRAAVVERRAIASSYRTASAAAAEQVGRIAQVSYEAGEGGILELLDAYRTTSTARVRQAALDAAAREAEIELEFVSGWEIP